MAIPYAGVGAVTRYGHFKEILPKASKLLEFFDMIYGAAKAFNGKQLLRNLAI